MIQSTLMGRQAIIWSVSNVYPCKWLTLLLAIVICQKVISRTQCSDRSCISINIGIMILPPLRKGVHLHIIGRGSRCGHETSVFLHVARSGTGNRPCRNTYVQRHVPIGLYSLVACFITRLARSRRLSSPFKSLSELNSDTAQLSGVTIPLRHFNRYVYNIEEHGSANC